MAAVVATLLAGVFIKEPNAPLLRTKGGADTFALYRQDGTAASALGATCAAGTPLRAQYASTRGYLMILEVDGAGAVQVLFPATGATSASIDPGKQLTPGSWVLDATRGEERFVAVFSEEPIGLESALRALRTGSAIAGRGVRQVEVRCRK